MTSIEQLLLLGNKRCYVFDVFYMIIQIRQRVSFKAKLNCAAFELFAIRVVIRIPLQTNFCVC